MVIVMQGNEIKMLVEGEMRSIIPFVGCVRQKELLGPKAVELSDSLTIGIGFCFRDTITDRSGDFWIPPKPMLISCWRAIAFLNHLSMIYKYTLNVCWNAAVDPPDSIKREIVNSLPSAKELDKMLQIVLDNEIKIDVEELKSLVEKSRIKSTPLLESVLKQNECWLSGGNENVWQT